MAGVLGNILEKKKLWLEEQRRNFPLGSLESMLAQAPAPRDFYGALLKKEQGAIPVIAEIKRQSPSKGAILPGLDPAGLAKKYEASGAAAISVLCEQDFFGGSLEDLGTAKRNCTVPVLCKDFTISTFQVLLARIFGADIILLIVSALDQEKLEELFTLTRELQMAPLVEVHEEKELERAIALGARLIGINNRNLSTLEVNIDTTRRLLPMVPKDRIVISESGFSKREELLDFQSLGVAAFLIGGSLLESEDPEQKLRDLVHGQG